MEKPVKQASAYGRFLTSAQAIVIYAVFVLAVAALDVFTRASLDVTTRVKLLVWMTGTLVMTVRIVRVLRRSEASGTEWGEAEKMLFILAALMPIAGIIPLAFL